MSRTLLSFSLAALLATAATALERPPREQRMAACQADVGKGKTACFPTPELSGPKALPLNAKYGWYFGKGHPSDEQDPPPYTKLLNGFDQCAWFHDRAAWRWNPRTKLCEGQNMCANTVGLLRCLDAYQPESPAETQAKKLAMHGFLRLGETCVRKLYKTYGAEFQRDAHGSQWLNDKSLRELSEAFSHCKPLQPVRGFEEELTRLKLGANFK